ncbi:ABC transporter substrate-binding protein [Pelagibacterium lentulum]|uniref:ABC transporter substrate-binding protein n=1 Tax=Pelagibacterium lentulum TaxID=2029865 RepID=A0A916VV97_9HYPH|nr:ABC transporter substrate-binding protein [Pelagibacterium lentulum]GGA39542.1 ABC transporter substrate-binding protein [Pelagibacterium lentulum]
MKTLLRGVALAVLLAASPAVAQTPPNVLVVGQIAEPQSLDPHVVTAANDFRILINVFEGLVRFAEGTLEVEPALATDWTISEDGLVYTFNLRDDVTFHDGTPFNAEAVKFTFDRMLDEDHPYYDTGPFPLSFFFADIAETTVVDEFTVEFTLSQPFAPFMSNLAGTSGVIVSPAAVAEHGEDFGRNPVGTGPFRFEEWASNTRVVVSRNDDYWGEPAGVEAVVFRPVTDANTRVAEMLSGGIDVMVEVPPDNVAMFSDDPGFTVHDAVGPHVWYVMLNMLEGPFTDVRVRQAANYAVNKESLVNDVLQGTADVSAGPIPPAFNWAYNENVAPYPYDPDRARELLQEAGIDDLSVTFYVTEGGSGMLDPIPMGTAIQADLAAVGFDVSIETYEWNTFLANVNPGLEGKADMAQMAWMTSDPDTLPFLTLRTAAWPDAGGFNSSYYSNIDVDEMLDQARMDTDPETRAALYRDVQQVVHDDAPWIFVANWKQNAVTTSNVEGFALQPDFNLVLKGVTKN